MEDTQGNSQVSDSEMKELFLHLYHSFLLHYYKELFHTAEKNDKNPDGLTTVELFCMEIIHFMKNPSINEFANVIGISSPNATYKVNSLIRKGYLEKIQSDSDKREFYLKETAKYLELYHQPSGYLYRMLRGMQQSLGREKAGDFRKFMELVVGEDEKEEKLIRDRNL
ncbi:MAG: MarR family transcriptional regulator [Eubacterium sp.]|nr:MarR family transcriptional regulator [Eubacterium sp.]